MTSFAARSLLLVFASTPALLAADAAVEGLLPISPEIRQILDQRCVMCHGEVIDGTPEIREDLDLSTDDAIRSTLHAQSMADLIATGEMPHKAKLSFRLRKRPEMQERLKEIKQAYDANGEQQKLLAWLGAAGITPDPEAGQKKKDE